MNKVVSYLLMMVFAFNSVCFANEVIFLGTSLEPDNSKKVAEIEPVVEIKEENKSEIKIKSIEEYSVPLKKQHDKYDKYLRKMNDNTWIYDLDSLKGYKYYNYSFSDNFDKNDKNILRFELQDGDYALFNSNIKGNRKYKYAAEYHKNGELFGIVQIRTIEKKRNSALVVFREYRKESDKFTRKHTMVLDIKDDGNIFNARQFIYKNTPWFGNLLCVQINNNVYLSKDAKNLAVKMQKFEIPDKELTSDSFKNKTADTVGSILFTIFSPITVPIGVCILIWWFSGF